jgi:hypothetical protein
VERGGVGEVVRKRWCRECGEEEVVSRKDMMGITESVEDGD